MCGKGSFESVDGDKYFGDWLFHKKEGQGTCIWSMGDNYVGNRVNGEWTGLGTLTWSNEDR